MYLQPAADHFPGKCHKGLRALGRRVENNARQTVAGRFGQADIAQNDGIKDLVAKVSLELLADMLLACDMERDGPAVLVAHSLGCQHVAAWAAHSRNTHRVRAALLVAPPDVERDDVRALLPSWSPIALGALPFAASLLASSNDPYCSAARARQFAAAWGADFIDAGPRGHLNADSGLDDWPEAHDQLRQLMRDTSA